jgi:hypothetical protein
VAQGINALIDAGFPEEAFGLSRTMVEIALNLRFIQTAIPSSAQKDSFTTYRAGRWN